MPGSFKTPILDGDSLAIKQEIIAIVPAIQSKIASIETKFLKNIFKTLFFSFFAISLCP